MSQKLRETIIGYLAEVVGVCDILRWRPGKGGHNAAEIVSLGAAVWGQYAFV